MLRRRRQMRKLRRVARVLLELDPARRPAVETRLRPRSRAVFGRGCSGRVRSRRARPTRVGPIPPPAAATLPAQARMTATPVPTLHLSVNGGSTRARRATRAAEVACGGYAAAASGGGSSSRRLNDSDSSRLRRRRLPSPASSSSSKIARASGVQPASPAAPLGRRASRAAPRSARPRRRSAGRRAAARPCRSSGSPAAGTRRRSGPARRRRSSWAPKPNAIAAPASRPRWLTRKRRCLPSPTVDERGRARSRRRAASRPGCRGRTARGAPSSSQSGSPSSAPATTASTGDPRAQVVVGQHLVGVRGERRGERLDALGADRQPGGGAVAAEALEVLRRRRRARRAGRTRPSSGPSPSSRRRCRRSARPAGRSARRAARRRSRSRPRASPRRRRRSRGGGGAPPATTRSRRSPRAGSAPRRPAARGSAPRAPRRAASASRWSSVSSSSSAASGRPSRPAALIRGASRKPIAPSSQAAGSTPATRISARRPGFCVCASRRRPEARERAVLVDERHDVGDGRERDDVEVPLEERMARAEQRLGELPDDARCRRGRRRDSRP